MHTHRANAAWLVEIKQADYLLQVKANQPSVLEACRAIPDAQFGEVFEHTERGHGRIETREVRVAPAPEGLFPYARQVIVVYRERSGLDGKMTSSETSYYLTSIATEDGDAQLLAGHVRGHWQIENRVHWVRDWSFDEDRHQLRSLNSPAQVLATLRNLSISLIRLAGSNQILSAMRWIARSPQRSAQLIGAMPA